MVEIMTMGEMLVEVMRPRPEMSLSEAGEFLGPFPSGAPAIFIDTAARLGHSSAMIGGIGDDDFGRCLTDRLKTDGLDLSFVRSYTPGATAVAFVTYFDDGARRFIFHIDGTPAVRPDFTHQAMQEKPAFFHVMGCSLMANDHFRAEIFKAVEYYHDHGARISFDPNIRPELLGEKDLLDIIGPVLDRSAILFPGVAELELLSGTPVIDKSVELLFTNPLLELIVLKRGRQGATVYSRDQVIQIPAYSVPEVDPTGAGDCFDGGFLSGLLEHRPLSDCGRIAAAAGALNAAAFGPMEGKISPETVWGLIRSQG